MPTAPQAGAEVAPGEAARVPIDRRIGPYRLLHELGRGGFGVVYLAARADEEYQKHVAIKILRGEIEGDAAVRFRRERQILAALEHPNIARLLDGGTTEDGVPYIVMEYVQGLKVDDYCDRQRLTIPQRLELFREVCSAVAFAHRNLIVHRDLKPGNILVTPEGVPKLLDFGLAKLLNAELAPEAPATAYVMTPEYASPEQVRGEPITTATDVYALGVVLYELLVGRLPYRLRSQQPFEVLRAICDEEPERLSVALRRTRELAMGDALQADAVSRARATTLERLRRALAGDLDSIVLMALRKEPSRRYSSVEALRADIGAFLANEPVQARKGSALYLARKYVRRHALAVTAASTFVLLLAGFSVATAIQSSRLARERDRAALERDRAARVSAFLVHLFKVADPTEAKGNRVTAREILDKGAARIRQELHDEPEVQATLMDTLGNVYASLGLYEEARGFLRDALKSRRRLLGNDSAAVAETLDGLAAALEGKNNLIGAEAADREALALRRRLYGDDNLDVARSLNGLADILDDERDYAAAESDYRQALAIRRKLLGNEHAEVAESLNGLGIARDLQGDYAGAEAAYREALAQRRKLLGNDAPEVATTLGNLAIILEERGDYEGAQALYREALATKRRIYGNENPEVEASLSNLALSLRDAGDDAGAEALLREALAMRRKLYGEDGAATLSTAMLLAGVIENQGRHAEAESMLRDSLRAARAIGDPTRYVAFGESLLGDTLTAEGRAGEAEPLLRDAYERERSAGTAQEDIIATAASSLGGCLVRLQKYPEAEGLLLGAFWTLEAKRSDRYPETQKTRRRLVELYEAWGKPEKAAQFRPRAATPAGAPSRAAAAAPRPPVR